MVITGSLRFTRAVSGLNFLFAIGRLNIIELNLERGRPLDRTTWYATVALFNTGVTFITQERSVSVLTVGCFRKLEVSGYTDPLAKAAYVTLGIMERYLRVGFNGGLFGMSCSLFQKNRRPWKLGWI